MNINRNTYENYFLLYVDNELSAADRKEVEAFVEANPDLLPELEMLQEAVLSLETEPVFIDKTMLLKPGSQNPVNPTNYEEYFVLYADDELNDSERQQVHEFIVKNPQYQQEFDLILQCKTAPDTAIVFEDKASLYRQEKERRVVPIMWKQMAAAAILLLILGGAGWYYTSRNQETTPGLATVEEVKKPEAPATSSTDVKHVEENPVVASPAEENQTIETIAEPKKNFATKENTKKSEPVSNKTEELFVTHETPELAMNESPDAAEVQGQVETYRGTVGVIDEAIDEQTLRNRSGVAAANQAAVIIPDQETESNVIYVANTSVSKKNKLRGFFRTASRIVERATNPESTQNERSGIRIANFEIDL